MADQPKEGGIFKKFTDMLDPSKAKEKMDKMAEKVGQMADEVKKVTQETKQKLDDVAGNAQSTIASVKGKMGSGNKDAASQEKKDDTNKPSP